MCNLQEYLKRLTPARDRRVKMRVTPASPVYVTFGDTGGSVVNAAETGMAIAIAVGNLPAVGDYLIRLRLQLPMSNQNVEVSARIVWLRESKKVIGVRLVDCTAEARSRISNWIASEKLATEFEQPAQLLAHNRQPLAIGSSSNPSARDEEAAAHYAQVFPAENNYAKHLTPVEENAPLIAGFGSQSPTDQVKSSADSAVDSSSHPYIFDLSGLHVAALVFLFAVVGLIIGIAATKASVDILASLGRGPFGKHARLHSQSRTTEPLNGLRSDSAPSLFPTETSPAQTSRSSVDLDSSIGADRVGVRPLPEEAKGDALSSEPEGSVHPRDSNSSISAIAEHETSADSERHPNRNDLRRLIARSMSSQASAEHVHSTTAVGPKGTGAGNPNLDSRKSVAAAASPPTASPKPKNSAIVRSSLGATPKSPAPPIEKSPATTAPTPRPPANSEPARPATVEGSLSAAPRNPVPAAAPQPNPSPAADLVTIPSKGNKPLKLVFPQKQIALSSSLMITTQLSVFVPPGSGLVAAQASRLQAGKLVSYVLPRNPRPGNQYRAEETVKVHATIGQQGLVTEIKPLSGPIFLLSSTMGAVHLWRYKPTLLNGMPIETQQDVTVIFKLPR